MKINAIWDVARNHAGKITLAVAGAGLFGGSLHLKSQLPKTDAEWTSRIEEDCHKQAGFYFGYDDYNSHVGNFLNACNAVRKASIISPTTLQCEGSKAVQSILKKQDSESYYYMMNNPNLREGLKFAALPSQRVCAKAKLDLTK